MSAIETKVRSRLRDEKRELEREAKDADRQRTPAQREYEKAAAELDKLSAQAIELDDKGEVVPDELKAKIDAAHRRTMRAQGQVIALGNKRNRARELADRLATDAEFRRRVEKAQQLAELRAKQNGKTETAARGEGQVSNKDAAIIVLRDEGGPLHYRDITRIALETGLLAPEGKTPEATVNAALSTRAKKGDTFKKVGAGVFDLLDRAAVAA